MGRLVYNIGKLLLMRHLVCNYCCFLSQTVTPRSKCFLFVCPTTGQEHKTTGYLHLSESNLHLMPYV